MLGTRQRSLIRSGVESLRYVDKWSLIFQAFIGRSLGIEHHDASLL